MMGFVNLMPWMIAFSHFWGLPHAHGTCLTPIQNLPVPTQFYHCQSNKDCVLVKEACRSCITQVAVNKNHLQQFLSIDQKDREANKCVIACEACDQSRFKPICRNGKCDADENAKKDGG